MIVTVNSQRLAAELRLLNKVVPSNPAIAILASTLLTAADELSFYATDLEVGLTTTCQAKIEGTGIVALPVAKLLALVEQFPDADVVINSDGTKTTLKCGSFNSRLQAFPANDFPHQLEIEGMEATIDADAFKLLVSRCRPAIVANATKFVLQGALLRLKGQGAAMVATDSKRLVIASVAAVHSQDFDAIVPVKALDMLGSQPATGDVTVTVGERGLSFEVGHRTLHARVMEGKFPAFERIIPDNPFVASVDRNGLRAVLKRIVQVSDGNRSTYLELAPDLMTISSTSADVGSADEPVTMQYAGEPLKVVVNGDFLLDFLESASPSQVEMKFKDDKGAILLTAGVDHACVMMLMSRR